MVLIYQFLFQDSIDDVHLSYRLLPALRNVKTLTNQCLVTLAAQNPAGTYILQVDSIP